MKGAVWTLPVVALAVPAPAFAASCTTPYAGSINWASNYTRGGSTSGSATSSLASGAGTVTTTLSSSFTRYSAYAGNPSNLDDYSPVGGTGAAGLSLTQIVSKNSGGTEYSNSPNYNQTLTISFSRAVYNLSFLITDIDYNGGQYADRVAVTGAGYTATTPTGSLVTVGNGTTDSPFQSTGTTTINDNSSTAGNKLLTFVGPVNQINIIYWNGLTPSQITSNNPAQGIWLSNMTFGAHNTGCA